MRESLCTRSTLTLNPKSTIVSHPTFGSGETAVEPPYFFAKDIFVAEDIGIVHPDKPGNYILRVECDGATYHSSKSARDRDRLREDVLILNLEDSSCLINRLVS
jgi:hypothetical protein